MMIDVVFSSLKVNKFLMLFFKRLYNLHAHNSFFIHCQFIIMTNLIYFKVSNVCI